YACMYRCIESPYVDIYHFVDGVNTYARHAWVATNPDDYDSDLFAAAYEPRDYVNGYAEDCVTEVGWSRAHHYEEFPVSVGGSSTTYYSDNYYEGAGQYIARVGGNWFNGSNAGPSLWNLTGMSSTAIVSISGRLVKKPL